MVLLTEDPHWVWILPRGRELFQYASEAEYWEHCGKYVVTGDKTYIMDLAFRVDPYVESGRIDSAKFTKKDPNTDPLPHVPEFAMCVYSDDRRKGETAEILVRELGVHEFTWKYNRETLTDWSEGGQLAQKAAEVGRKVDPMKY